MQKLLPLSALVFLFALPGLAQDDAGEPEPTAPDGWTCSASYYGSDDGCDCGCGIVDSDCADDSVESCGYRWCGSNASLDPADSTACIDDPPPADGWTCQASYYGGDDGCDCGCGAPDTDCESSAYESCRYNYCPSGEVPSASDTTQCEPGDWVSPVGSSDDGDVGDDNVTGDDPSGDDVADDDGAKPGDSPADLGPSNEPSGGNDNFAPPDDEQQTDTGDEPQVSGCSSITGTPAADLLALLLLLGFRRRRRT